MTDKITFDIIGADVIERYFSDLPEEVYTAMVAKMKYLAEDLEGHIILDKLNGQVLNYITGKLARSVTSSVAGESATTITATISAGDSEAPYAAIHEYGGVVRIGKTTLPVTAQALQFSDGTFHASARAHDIPIPERSYMRSALEDMRGQIQAELSKEFLATMARHFQGSWGGVWAL